MEISLGESTEKSFASPSLQTMTMCRIIRIAKMYRLFFYKQLHFPSQPGVAKEIWGNEAESCLAVAYVLGCFLHEIKENGHF